ncbi:MAG: farnesyl diphosphate synthase [Longicatena sp.]|nr:farnesyl diphosphate synthase [Longicatena sp.]
MKTFEQYLKDLFATLPNSRVVDAMKYSLEAGGKRARPKLLFAALKDYGLNEEIGYAAGAAIEMIHTYSLIHDDLPAMDDDTLRRGLPTCHIAFDEASAILAGDGLLTHAFYLAANASDDPKIAMNIVKAVSMYSGAAGMIHGQCLDLAAEKQTSITIEEILQIHEYKTAKLLTLPLLCAAYLANREEDCPLWMEFGKHIGLAFQIQDDILDVTSSEEVLGKNINSDVAQEKNTYVTLKGLAQAQLDVDAHFTRAFEILDQLNLQDSNVSDIAKGLQNRKN